MGASFYFFREEIRQRLADGLLGWSTILVLPFLQLAIFYLVFVEIFQTRTGVDAQGNYLLFLVLGLWPWLAFSETVLRLSSTLIEKSALAKKVRFSRFSVLLGVGLASYLFHALGFVVVLAALALLGFIQPSLHYVVCVLPWVLLLVFALALGTLGAIISVFVRDLPKILGLLMTLVFFLTPVFYPTVTLPDSFREALLWNPVATILDFHRAVFSIGGSDARDLAAACLTIMVSVALAVGIYRRFDPHIEDFL